MSPVRVPTIPLLQHSQMFRDLAPSRWLIDGAAKPMQAQIIGATLEQHDFGGSAERRCHSREIPMKQLVLQCFGARGEYRPATRQQDRHKVRQRFTGAGARLDYEVVSVLNRGRNPPPPFAPGRPAAQNHPGSRPGSCRQRTGYR